MTKNEFYEKLKALNKKWVRVGYEPLPCIRCADDDSCPICCVFNSVMEQKGDPTRLIGEYLAAAQEIGLSEYEAGQIAIAADGTFRLNDPAFEERKRLEEACGL